MKTASRINLSIVVFLILAALIFNFGVYSVFKNIERNSMELIRQKKELAALDIQIADLEKFKSVYLEVEEAAERINSLFIDARVPVSFIRFLEDMAENCRLEISISPVSSGKFSNDYWQSLVFQISSKGSFSDILRFLEKLENSPYLIEIQTLTVSQGEEGIRAVFAIKVFAQ